MKALRRTMTTAVWYEEAVPENPFFPKHSFCHGYNFYGDLIGKADFASLIFLHLRGELPGREERDRFDFLLAAVMNPGPRHPQNQSAMAAAVGGCPPGAALMAGFSSSMGQTEGGMAVENVIRMLNELSPTAAGTRPPLSFAFLRDRFAIQDEIPGFGTLYGIQDIQALQVVSRLKKNGWVGKKLALLLELETLIRPHRREWIRLYGVVAAGWADLGITPAQGHGLYMLASGFGMLAFLAERYDQKWYDFPTWYTHGTYRYEPNRTAHRVRPPEEESDR